MLFASLTAMVVWAGAKLRGKWKNEAAVSLIERVERLASYVVKELDHQLVQALKKASEDGRLTPEEIAMISKEALQRLTQLLGEQGRKELPLVLGDVEKFMRTLLEAKVSDLRLAQKRGGPS